MNRQFLLFQLYGPLAAWGGIAVGDQRPSFDRPSKSAIMGLLGAALGLKRPNTAISDEEARRLEEQHQQLAESYFFAGRVDAHGVYLEDYHTVQVPEGKTMPSWIAARTDEIKLVQEQARADPKKGTKQTWREHYVGMRATICLWPKSEQEMTYSLHKLCCELKKPDFVLYLGRKASPPGLPLAPYVEDQATNVREALERAVARYDVQLDCLLGHPQHKSNTAVPLQDDSIRYFWESDRDEGFGQDYAIESRWDKLDSRSRWQFRPRTEHIKSIPRGN